MSRTIDILAIGALNVDRIFSDPMSPALVRSLSAICPQIAWGGEILLDEEQFAEVGKRFDRHARNVQLGGSAYNALRTARAIDPDKRMGFIGTIGEEPAADGFSDWFERNRISTPFVMRAEGLLSGGCVSLEDSGERTLLTTRGANDHTADMLVRNMAVVVEWARTASLIHVSSFLDDRSPTVLGEFLGHCRAHNPALQVTIDPGAHWATRYVHDSSVRDLLAWADLLFVNQREFDAIWGDGEPTLNDFSRRINNGNVRSAAVLLKRPGRLTIFDHKGAVLEDIEHIRLAKDQLATTTGAGDVLAGAFLVSLQDPRLTTAKRLAVAMAVVRASLSDGRSAEQKFESIFRSAVGLAG
jgi:sugar/nucleoside kinase (ribokinase family)